MRLTCRLVPAAVLSLAACGAGDRAAGDVVVRDSSGVRIVESPAPAWGRASPWTVSAEPLVTIGTVEGDAAYQLHRVGAALRLSDGRIVVANYGTSDLRYYAAAGRHVRTVGRQGEGPGEFSMLSGMVRGGADTVLVFDGRLLRLTVLAPDGSVARIVTFQAPRDTARFRGGLTPFSHALSGRLSGDRYVLTGFAFSVRLTEQPTVYRVSRPNLVYSSAGEPLDTLGRGLAMEMYAAQRLGGPYAFGRSTRAAVYDGRLYVGDPGAPEVLVYSADAGLERIFRYARPPERVTDDLFEAAVEHFVAQQSRYPIPGGDEASWRSFYAAMPRPESLPYYREMKVDALGHIWLEDWRPGWESGPRRWTVLDPDGRWLGTLTLPDIDVHDIGDDYILGVRKDELDVEYVELYALRRGGEPRTQ
jgi:hypothetical protein